jgi:two-component system, OmpR family, phosphate regulon sensor histidine kinase PhoR
MNLEFIHALADAATVLDGNGVVLAANQAAREILQTEPVGLQLASVLRSNALAQAMNEVRKSRVATSVDIDIYAGPQRQFGVHVAQLGNGDNLLVCLRDLTREQRVERMRADFIANASHEMRTPLASIIGLIETLQGPAKEDSKARVKFLSTMNQQAQRMRLLIDDLLALSRVEINEHVQPVSKTDLSDVAKQACANLVTLAQSLNVTLECDAQAPSFVRGNAEELLQVAQNLVENAIKYGASGGKVVVSCTNDNDDARLSVQDYGPGIEAIHIPRLTERFYRVNTRESRTLGGTGLGLAIVKHIVSRHRGRLEINSVPGQGSLFAVKIPLFKS